MAKATEVLRAHQSTEKSHWREQAQWNVENWGWIRHSTQIALKARGRMRDLGITQKDLAERMGCSQQYVSLILQGKENLTLETISKLEKAIDMDILAYTSSQSIVDGYSFPIRNRAQYLNEAESPEYGENK